MVAMGVGIGYISYSIMSNGPEWMRLWRNAVVLADPVAGPEHWQALTQAFLEDQRRQGLSAPLFVQASGWCSHAERAAVLRRWPT